MNALRTAYPSIPLPRIGIIFAVAFCVISCGDERPTEPPPNTIGPDGGTLSFAQGKVTLTIPAGALSEPVAIAVTATATFPPSATIAEGTTYEFKPHGTRFALPVELTIAYDPAGLPPGVRGAELRIFEAASAGWQEVTGCTVNTARQSVTGMIGGFSVYGILGAPVAAVTITPVNATIVEGETLRLSAERLDAQGNRLSERKLTWSSSDAEVASVDSTGLVTGIAQGSARITALSEGVQDTAEIAVTRPSVASVEIEPEGASIEVGEEVQLRAVVLDAKSDTLTDRTVDWSSTENGVATVSSSGLVEGLSGGAASIAAECEGVSDTVAITVREPDGLLRFVRPFAGSYKLSNFFDHDLPFQFSDNNGYQLTYWGEKTRGIDGHSGYDWLTPSGTPVRAVAGGEVVVAGADAPFYCPPLGTTVSGQLRIRIEHVATDGERFATGYVHLDRLDVGVGEYVTARQQIGISGNTGCSTEPHLHFNTYRWTEGDRQQIDPYGWEGPGPDPWTEHAGVESVWLWAEGEAPSIYREVYLPPNPQPADSAPVAITRVRWMGYKDDENPNNEYVEFALDPRFSDGSEFNLTVFRLANNEGHYYIFPGNTVVREGQPLRVYSGSGQNTTTELYWGSTSGVWHNMGDCVHLNWPNGPSMYRLSYGSACD